MTAKIKRIVFPAEMVNDLKAIAAKRGMSIQDLALLIIGNYLDDEANKGERE